MQLVEQIRQGDERAFEELYDHYSPAIYGLVLSIVRKESDAGDVTQDVFVKIWKNIARYDDKKGTLFTWMLNIARNTSIDFLRKHRKMVVVENQNLESDVSMSNGVETVKVEHIGIRDLVNKIEPEYRQVIDYMYFKGYTQQEISDELQIPLGTVKTRSRIAMRELNKMFMLLVTWM